MSLSLSDRKRMQASLVGVIRKKHGPGMIIDSKNPEPVAAISTGSLKLDALIGCNGYARGRLIEIFGDTGSRKINILLSRVH